MRKKIKSLCISLLVLVIIAALSASTVAVQAAVAQTTQEGAGAQSAGSLILSVEAFTVGCGFIRQPFEADYSVGDTLYDVIEKNVGKEQMNFNQNLGRELVSFPVNSGLTSVNYEIRETLISEDIPFSNNISQRNWLSNDDFVKGSKWYVTVNNSPVKTAVDTQTPVADSVVRVQFSLYGNGSDLNQSANPFVTPPAGTKAPKVIYPVTKRDDLYKAMAEYSKDNILEISDTILKVVTDLGSNQADLDAALKEIKNSIETIDPKDFEELEEDSDDELETDTDNDDDDDNISEIESDDDTDTDNDTENGIPVETDPPVTVPNPETTTGTLPYIPDDGNGSGNLAKEDSAPTGVNMSAPIIFMTVSAAAAVVLRKKR